MTPWPADEYYRMFGTELRQEVSRFHALVELGVPHITVWPRTMKKLEKFRSMYCYQRNWDGMTWKGVPIVERE